MEILVNTLDYVEPQVIFNNVAHQKNTIFLDSSMQHEHYGHYSLLMVNPIEIYKASEQSGISEQIISWKQLFAKNQLGAGSKYASLPFIGGLVGFFSYDLGKKFEDISENSETIVEDYYFGLYNQVFIFDLLNKISYIVVAKLDGYVLPYEQQFSNLNSLYHRCKYLPALVENTYIPPIKLVSNFTKQQYLDTVRKAITYIRQGDIFEVNLAQCYSGVLIPDYPYVGLYNKLRLFNPAPFSAYINFDPLVIMSSSPERFVAISGRKIEVCPIKGTSKRSLDPYQDNKLADNLALSEKNRAENIMIVDLMRNDLSKICNKQSVHVTQLCNVEAFTNVHHLVSVITGELKADASIFDIIIAAFPGGSISGAPKIRAMQIIEELESMKRGVYCGSIGYFSFNGSVDLSIAIRTLIKNNNDLRFYVGGAITLDSDPLEEYQETLVKGQKLSEILQ